MLSACIQPAVHPVNALTQPASCMRAQPVVRTVNALTATFNPRFLAYLALALNGSLPALPWPLLGVGLVAAAAGLVLGQLLQVHDCE